jgi:hypothetical protein
MVAASNQQETVMDTQKVETRALSDDELDAVSGGDNKAIAAMTKQAQADLQAQLQQQAEDKKAGDQIKAFQQLLQELP